MDLSTALSARVNFTLAGRPFVAGPLTLGDIAAAQVHLKSLFQTELRELNELTRDLPPEVRNDAIRRLLDSRSVTVDQASGWLMSSLDGLSFFLHFKVTQLSPAALSPVEARQIVSSATPAELKAMVRAISLASGLGEETDPTSRSGVAATVAAPNPSGTPTPTT